MEMAVPAVGALGQDQLRRGVLVTHQAPVQRKGQTVALAQLVQILTTQVVEAAERLLRVIPGQRGLVVQEQLTL